MPNINNTLYMELYQEIKHKIINKTLTPETKLESIRSYALKRGVSTTTVEKAYTQLMVEGYITSLPKSGYYVLNIESPSKVTVEDSITPIKPIIHTNNKLSEELFDMKMYKSIINKVINYHGDQLYHECDPRGEIELREQIQKYVLDERGVACDVNQIIIGPGIQPLLQILLHLKDFDTLAYLSPGFQKALHIFSERGYQLFPHSSIDEILKRRTDYLYISPSNKYPTGEVIKIQDRINLIKWAEENNSFIIEDDYNYFIRYNSYSIPSIHSLNKNKVIYMGSFSKLLLPSIRISFMILPKKLYNLYIKEVNTYSQGVSKLEQLSLALYMKENLLKRHTKKLYQAYKTKNQLVKEAFNQYRDLIILTGTDSNLHVILEFNTSDTRDRFIQNCNQYSYSYKLLNQEKILFPYSGIHNDDINIVISRLFE